jgi:DNA modification methylase
MTIQLFSGDCLEIMPTLEAGSIDAIITDLPYGTTACSWDEVIPFEPMWVAVKRILKPRGVFVTTTNQPFTSKLIMSNLDWFKYEIIWEKSTPTGFLDANRKPLRAHENICVFSENGNIYNPQKWQGQPNHSYKTRRPSQHQVYGAVKERLEQNLTGDKYPRSVLHINSEHGIHPTQKPILLYTYLVLTYTNPGDTVLDFCMGSGTTGISCVTTGRNFVGCENKPDYFAIANRRIKAAERQSVMSI